ncbi:putative phospholipid transporting ATPase-like protein [Trypanosoma rangeli]|uniref:Phospholipid-transporting ATPase n=1 Tax=Trypanosoma rangeli TaxID=5698 RepID=A0A422MUL3_TRYRA|nr:putative phospholipid transporting ATPase-like protein [Trypanosoma rangeli]RNE96924.1 putative phospholipid transporting ATPase-like protein [Trypanosoma rangeli]|eukprot:RNE96924.1 putative phospholipid transporting ATPase-like protein [Trypanosoma rangeli]
MFFGITGKAARLWRRFCRRVRRRGPPPSLGAEAVPGVVTGVEREELREDSAASSDAFMSASFVEVNVLREDLNAAHHYPDNSIRTAKYTSLTCFPHSLLCQFQRVSNIYFLVVMLFCIIPGVSPVNPFSLSVPFSIVLGAAIAKDLWEDGRRRQSDRRANNMMAYVLRGENFVGVPAHSVRVGDVMLCALGEEVLADVVLLNSSLAGGIAYIETANLDGETNAKSRRAKAQTIEALGVAEDIIERCLPDPAMRAHFLAQGTTASWSAAVAAGDVVDAPTPVELSVVPPQAFRTEGAEPAARVPQPGLRKVVREKGCPFSVQPVSSHGTPLLSLRPGAHTRSKTYGIWEHPATEVQTPHRRQLSFDEKFVVGREVPVPSHILELSQRYKEKHAMDHHHHHHHHHHQQQLHRRSSSQLLFPNGGMLQVPTGETVSNSVERSGEGSTIYNNRGVLLLGAPPCSELHSWIGQLWMPDGEMVPLGIDQFLPRGCVIRNTEWVLCVVVYTGRDTKMLLNLRSKPKKMSVVARRINILNCFLLLLHQSFLFFLCGLAVLWRNSHLAAPPGTRSGYSTWYIQWSLSRYSPREMFGWRYFTNFILLSHLIPLSMYVTLEFNKAMQMVLITHDRRMANYDEFLGELRYSRPKTSELNCQLAQVRYIFTDKTGTLTENIMKYVGGCTATQDYNEQKRPGGLGEDFLHLLESRLQKCGGEIAAVAPVPHCDFAMRFDFDESAMESEPLFQYLRALALCHSVVSFDRSSVEQGALLSSSCVSQRSQVCEAGSPHFPRMSSEAREVPVTNQSMPAGLSSAASNPQQNHSVFHSSTDGIGRLLQGRAGSSGWYATRFNDIQMHQRPATMSRLVSGLKDESKIYEAQSLDEIALVTAARDNLFSLQKRTAKHIFIKAVNRMMCYEIVAELEFTPQRKLMSILLYRRPECDTEVFEQSNTHKSYHRQSTINTSFLTLREGGGRSVQIVDILPLAPESPLGKNERDDTISKVDVAVAGVQGGLGALRFINEERPYLLLVKGADSSMMPILNKNNPRNVELKPVFQQKLETMAQKGLRTLVMGQRYLSESEVRGWLPCFNEAQCSMHDRSDKLHAVYAMLEKDVDLVGTTAVEDRLQEGVPETLKFFLEAEIVVWMLTGDKRETAVTIAGTSGLIDPGFGDCLVHLDLADVSAGFVGVAEAAADAAVWRSLQEQMEAAVQKCDASDEIHHNTHTVVLVVDGRTLDIIFTDEACTQRFFKLGIRCRSAVCCRMTPLQKARVVKLFQKNTRSVALAIGDGANDVSMIQESRIGVGIMGLEGSQAELSSDYAIPKFRFLKRLLMVHGRFAMYRDAHCVIFSLYKSVVLCTGLATYAFFCGFSGMVLVDSWLLAMFNLFFCSLQPLILGIFDKDVDDELAESLPSLYPALAREQMFFSWPYILKWLFDGVVDGLMLFFAVFYTVGKWDELYPHRTASIEDYGMLFFVMLLFLLNLRVAALMTYYTVLSAAVIALGFVAIPLLTIAYSVLPNVLGSNWCVGIAFELMRTNKFWMLMLLTSGLFIVYGVAVNTYIALFWPWTNGGPAMQAAWRSPYRMAHKTRVRCLR